MADNVDKFPQINRRPKPNVITNGQFIADGNFVHPTAESVIVTGVNNFVGQGCKNITLLNSSGCIVLADIEGATVFNSSGTVVTASNTIYINGILLDTNGIDKPVQMSFLLMGG